MNLIYKIAAALLSVALSLAGYPEKTETPDNELKIAMFGKEPEGFDKVVSEARRRLYDAGLGEYDLRFEFISDDDEDNNYRDTMYVQLLAGDEYDIVFDSTSRNFSAFRSMEIYQPLEDYIFETDDYPYLRDMYPENVWIAQKSSYGHIYGIPHFRNYGSAAQCVFYRQDFADEWGLGEITDMGTLKKYMENCLKYRENITPYAVSEGSGALALLTEDETELLNNHIVKYSTGRIIAYILLNETNSQVKDIVMFNEPEAAFGVLPEQYRSGEGLEAQRWIKCGEWGSFFDTDKERKVKPKELFTGGETAAYTAGYSELYSLRTDLKKNNPDAEVGRMFLNPADIDEYRIKITKLSFSSFSCIPITSRKVEKSLAFLNWLASDKENMNLFAYGIEGEHWEYTDGLDYKKISKPENYSLNGDNLTNYPGNMMISAGSNPEVKRRDRFSADLDNFMISPITGFTFDTSKVSDEAGRVNNTITDDDRKDFINGRMENPAEKMREYYEELSSAQDKIKAELRIQVDYFLEHGENMPKKEGFKLN